FLRNSHWGRAQALTQLGRHAEAVQDWDRALELDEGPNRPTFRLSRAVNLAQLGQDQQATTEVEAVLQAGPPTADRLYDAACVFALSAGKAGDPAVQERYAARAVALLRDAVAKGYNKVAHLKKDSDLDALRQRADFQQLLADLEAKKP